MNVQTAIARADEIAAAVTGVVQKYRAEHRMRPKPVLAVWVGADQSIGDLLSGAGIPNYQTGGDAVLGFMHLVRHREVVEALAQVPPAMPSEFAPDIERGAADRCRGTGRWSLLARSDRGQAAVRRL